MNELQFPWNALDGAPRVALLLLGHRDYQNDVGLRFAREAVAQLQAQGCEVVNEPRPLVDATTAVAAAQEVLASRPDGCIVLPGTWLEGDTALAAIREIEHLPFVLWGLPMYEHEGRKESTGSFVAACSLKGPLERMGYTFRMVIGLPEDETTQARIAGFARAAAAVRKLKHTRLGLMGYVAMSIYAGTFDHVLLRRIIGPEVLHLDTSSLLRAMPGVAEDTARGWVGGFLDGGGGVQAPGLQDGGGVQAPGLQVETTEARLLEAGRMAEALAGLCQQHGLHGLNVKCQYELSQDYGMTPCLPLALLADRGLIASCEGDMQVHVTQTILRHLTGQVVSYADLLDLDGKRGLFSACGFAPLSLRHPADPCRICEFAHPGFSGLICAITLKRGPVTFAQLSEGRGDYRLMYGTGTGVDTELRGGCFPALQVALDGNPDELVREIKGQHFALCYGDVTQELEMVCEMLGIAAVRV